MSVLWRPECLPSIVILANAPKGLTEASPIGPAILASAIAKSEGDDGLHIRLFDNHQLWFIDKNINGPLTVVLPLNGHLPLRAASAVRLYKLLSKRRAGPIPSAQALTPQQRRRLTLMLKALDGRLSEASYREIASALFGPYAINEKGWKTHPIRGKTIRLVNDSVKMMNQGYLKLLRGRPRD